MSKSFNTVRTQIEKDHGFNPGRKRSPGTSASSFAKKRQEFDLKPKELTSVYLKNLTSIVKNRTTVTLKITKCTTIGPPAVGKTCLKRLLVGQDFEKEHKSTDVMKAPEWVERYVEHKSAWKLFTNKECMNALMAKIMRGDHSKEQETSAQSKHYDKTESKGSSMQQEAPKRQESTHSYLDEGMVEGKAMSKNAQHLDALLSEILQGSDVAHVDVEGEVLGEKRLLYFIDTGGQEYYHDIHPILITSPTVYFVVFNLDECLENGGQAKFFQEELIQRPMHSIHAFAPTTVHTDHFKISSNAKIFIIGTHLDQVRGEKQDRITHISDKIMEELVNKPYQNFLQPTPDGLAFWPIDNTLAGRLNSPNTKDGELLYIDDLKSEVDHAEYDANVPVPIMWLVLEIEIRKMERSDQAHFFTYSELYNLCIKKKIVLNKHEYKTMLQTFHILGLFFFPTSLHKRNFELEDDDDIVFTNPDYFYRKTSELLKKCHSEEYTPVCLYSQGIIKDFDALLAIIEVEESIRTPFIRLLQNLRIVVHLKDQNLYLFPAALSQDISQPSPTRESLLLSFTSSQLLKDCYVPAGFFCLLIADLSKGCPPWNWRIQKDKLTRSIVVFHDSHNSVLTLIENVSFIEVRYNPVKPTREEYRSLYEHLQEVTLSQLQVLSGQEKSVIEDWVHWGFYCENHSAERNTHIAEFVGDSDEYVAICLHPTETAMQRVHGDQSAWFLP
jgi:GTPase SAR1 family protein